MFRMGKSDEFSRRAIYSGARYEPNLTREQKLWASVQG